MNPLFDSDIDDITQALSIQSTHPTMYPVLKESLENVSIEMPRLPAANRSIRPNVPNLTHFQASKSIYPVLFSNKVAQTHDVDVQNIPSESIYSSGKAVDADSCIAPIYPSLATLPCVVPENSPAIEPVINSGCHVPTDEESSGTDDLDDILLLDDVVQDVPSAFPLIADEVKSTNPLGKIPSIFPKQISSRNSHHPVETEAHASRNDWSSLKLFDRAISKHERVMSALDRESANSGRKRVSARTLSRAFQECVDAVDLIRPKETRNFNHIDGLPEFLLTFDSKTTPYVKQKILQYQQMDKIKIKAAVAPVRRTLAEMSQISNESSRQMDADINTMKHRIILDAELEKNITEERRRLQFNVDE